MGHGAQQIGTHSFFFRLHQHTVLFLDLYALFGEHDADTAGETGDKGHSHECQRVAAQCKIQGHIWVSISVIDPEHAVKRSDDTGTVAFGITGVEQNGQDVDDRYINGITAEMKDGIGSQRSYCHTGDRYRKCVQCIEKSNF